MKTKILSGVAIVLVIGLATGVYWWLSRPPVIRFSDDSRLILLGVDYGKRHVVPGGKLPKVTARPATPATGGRGPVVVNLNARTGNSSFQTPNDALVVWVRAKYDYTPNQPNQLNGFRPNQNPNFQFYVYDPANTACGQQYTSRIVSGNQRGDDVMAIQFDTFPRREGKLVVRAQEYYGGGNEMADGKFTILNPAAKKTFPKWTAEPMPNRQSDGDLAMTLTKLVAGADMPYQRNQDNPDDAMNKGAQVAFHIERAGKPVSNWSPVSVETTDATGNRTTLNYGIGGNQQVQWQGDEGAFTYQYGLWPDEPAWKVRMEMAQTSDFSTNDEWTAQNIPVVQGSQQSFNMIAGGRGGFGGRGAAAGRGGPAAIGATALPPAPTPFAEADMGGHHIKIFPAVLFTNQAVRPAGLPANTTFTQPQQTGLIIQVQPAVMNNGMMSAMIINNPNGTQRTDDGMRLTVAKVTDSEGGEIQSYGGGSSYTGTGPDSVSTMRITLRDTGDVTNLNVTISMHKNRFFEFTVKPEKAAAAQP